MDAEEWAAERAAQKARANQSLCKGCGRPIVWGAYCTPDGAVVKVPLDPTPPCYSLLPDNPLIDDMTAVHPLSRSDFMVSHFATCPKANAFSGRTRKAAR